MVDKFILLSLYEVPIPLSSTMLSTKSFCNFCISSLARLLYVFKIPCRPLLVFLTRAIFNVSKCTFSTKHL